jgi:outer membrane immunogenic protein
MKGLRMRINLRRFAMASAALAGCLAVIAGTSAVAAPAGYNWTGVYAGVRAGLTAGDSNWSSIVVPSDTSQNLPGKFVTSNPVGAIVGADVGYNYQMDQVVLGVEGDLNFSSAKASQSCFGSFGDFNASCRTKADWTGDVAVRLGFTPVDRVLIYGKAGAAYAHANFDPANENEGGSPVAGYSSSESDRWGYVLGVGADVAITDKWTIGAEYNFQDFGSQRVNFSPVGTPNFWNPPFSAETTLQLHSVVAKATYRF